MADKTYSFNFLAKLYDSEHLLEVKDLTYIKELSESKSSVTWGAGSLVGGWRTLASFSPSKADGLVTLLVCLESDYEKAIKS